MSGVLKNQGGLRQNIRRGWLNYFRLASIQVKLSELDGWLRNRRQYCIWTDWNQAKRAHEYYKNNKKRMSNKLIGGVKTLSDWALTSRWRTSGAELGWVAGLWLNGEALMNSIKGQKRYE